MNNVFVSHGNNELCGGITLKKLTCIICPRGCEMEIRTDEDGEGEEYIITGNMCKRGTIYAINELTDPHRSITSTVKTKFPEVPRLPVRTDREIGLQDIFSVMQELDEIVLDHPVHTGEIIIENVMETGANIIATSDLYELLEVM